MLWRTLIDNWATKYDKKNINNKKILKIPFNIISFKFNSDLPGTF